MNEIKDGNGIDGLGMASPASPTRF